MRAGGRAGGGAWSKPEWVMSAEEPTTRGLDEYFVSILNNKMRTQEEAREPEEHFASVLKKN